MAGPYIENYIPTVKYNGLNTQKACSFESTVTITGTTTLPASTTFTTPVIGAATGTTLSLTGAYTGKSATAVPATAGAVAAGAPLVMNSNGMTIEWTTDAPTHTRAKGSVVFNINGSSSSTRMYINTDGAGTWTAVTTAA